MPSCSVWCADRVLSVSIKITYGQTRYPPTLLTHTCNPPEPRHNETDVQNPFSHALEREFQASLVGRPCVGNIIHTCAHARCDCPNMQASERVLRLKLFSGFAERQAYTFSHKRMSKSPSALHAKRERERRRETRVCTFWGTQRNAACQDCD